MTGLKQCPKRILSVHSVHACECTLYGTCTCECLVFGALQNRNDYNSV